MPKNPREVLRQKIGRARNDLLALLASLTPEQWETAAYSEEASPDESWRVSDVLRHLMMAERGMIGLIEQIRDGGEGVSADFDVNRYNAAMVRRNKGRTPAQLLADLAANRERLLALMESLTEDDWEKRGRHGTMNIMSIAEIVRMIALHDRLHGHEIRQALKA